MCLLLLQLKLPVLSKQQLQQHPWHVLIAWRPADRPTGCACLAPPTQFQLHFHPQGWQMPPSSGNGRRGRIYYGTQVRCFFCSTVC